VAAGFSSVDHLFAVLIRFERFSRCADQLAAFIWASRAQLDARGGKRYISHR
jgi:hypothetical protein